MSYTTVVHHITREHNQRIIEDGQYYFCADKSCNTVYFDSEGRVYTKEMTRGVIGQKMDCPDRPICYCFDITEQNVLDEIAESGISESQRFVKSLTKAKHCACDIRNPSGKCCLADFPKAG